MLLNIRHFNVISIFTNFTFLYLLMTCVSRISVSVSGFITGRHSTLYCIGSTRGVNIVRAVSTPCLKPSLSARVMYTPTTTHDTDTPRYMYPSEPGVGQNSYE